MVEQKNKKVGSLWQNKDKNNNTYLNGVLNMGALGDVRISVLKNTFKDKAKDPSKAPDWNILLNDSEQLSKDNKAPKITDAL